MLWDWIRDEGRIRHLSLEMVDLNTLQPADFELNQHHNLRVLILYPWPYHEAGEEQQAETGDDCEVAEPKYARSAPTVEDRLLMQSELQSTALPPDSTHEGRLLAAIIREAPPHLRLLYIGGYRIWLARKLDGSDTATASSIVPLPLAYAKLSITERPIVNHVLREDDWRFMDSVPEAPILQLWPDTKIHADWGWPEVHLSEPMYAEKNYCVLTRREGFEPADGAL